MPSTLSQISPVHAGPSSRTAAPAAPVSVTRWGELRAERKLPGAVLRVLVAGQAAGGAERIGDVWRACWYTADYRDRCSEHASPEDAIRAVIRSGWARKLGARKTSFVRWSAQGRRTAGRTSPRA